MAKLGSRGNDQPTEARREHASERGGAIVAVWEGGRLSRALPASGKLTVGRAEECDLCIDHVSVSRHHARIHAARASVEIEDLGSTNGTRIAGAALARGNRAPMAAGVAVEVGAAVLVLRQMAEEREDAPRPASSEREIIVEDESMRRLFEMLDLVARSPMTVLLLGETGTGKEVVAQTIHRRSPRSQGPFVGFNCAAMPEALVETELFGHERGAYTGADRPRAGIIESADGGTLLLDEVGDLPAGAQAKLLRVLETRQVVRVGSTRARSIDVRFIAATHRDVEKMVADGQLRQDLYYRLDGFALRLPPLRERTADVPALARAFLAESCRREGRAVADISADAVEALCRHRWPGNVRELRNVIERAAVLSGCTTVALQHLTASVRGDAAEPPAVATPSAAGQPDPDRERIEAALSECAGNQTRAARLLGMSRRTLTRRLDEYRLARPKKGAGGRGG